MAVARDAPQLERADLGDVRFEPDRHEVAGFDNLSVDLMFGLPGQSLDDFRRSVEGVLALKPDIAVISECAEPARLRARGADRWLESEPVWIGRNPHKGLAVFAFNGHGARLCETYHPSLRYVAPVHVTAPTSAAIARA